MSNKNNTIDTTTRTKTEDSVNPSDGSLVNKSSNQSSGPAKPASKTREGIIKPSFNPVSTTDDPEDASMEASAGTQQDPEPAEGASAEELRKAAIEAGKRYQIARESHEDNADKASWLLLRLMLRVLEAFEQPSGVYDEAGFQTFLKDNGAPPSPKAGSDCHRLAKACTPAGMKSPRVSKLGGTLKALSESRVRSDTVMVELDKRLPIKEGGPSHFGAHRFFLLYQQDKKAADQKAKAGTEPANPYADWPKTKLLKQGKLLFEVLWKDHLIPPEFEGIEAALDAALAE